MSNSGCSAPADRHQANVQSVSPQVRKDQFLSNILNKVVGFSPGHQKGTDTSYQSFSANQLLRCW
jgi:hypothetical protein